MALFNVATPIFFLIFSVIIILLLAILAIVFWIFMIIDCARRKFKNENDKVIWILVLVLLGWIGAIIYYFVVRRKGKKR